MSNICGDTLDSPCIDAGNPNIEDFLLGCEWGLGGLRSDMGAYGGGDSITVGIDDPLENIPQQFMILQNYPNPFNASTTIRYLLPSTAHVKLEIYNILGRKIETLIEKTEQAGVNSVIWDANDHPSGVYFARLQTDTESTNIKMLMIK